MAVLLEQHYRQNFVLFSLTALVSVAYIPASNSRTAMVKTVEYSCYRNLLIARQPIHTNLRDFLSFLGLHLECFRVFLFHRRNVYRYTKCPLIGTVMHLCTVLALYNKHFLSFHCRSVGCFILCLCFYGVS